MKTFEEGKALLLKIYLSVCHRYGYELYQDIFVPQAQTHVGATHPQLTAGIFISLQKNKHPSVYTFIAIPIKIHSKVFL